MFGYTLELGSHMPVVHVPRNIQNNYQQCASDVLCWFRSVPMWEEGGAGGQHPYTTGSSWVTDADDGCSRMQTELLPLGSHR